jgi:hypothetical protein
MSNQQLKFWITCPNCKTAFGVEPRAIPQYLNRVLGALAAETPEAEQTAGDPSAEPTPAPAVPPPSRLPYRKYPKSGAGKPWQKR